MNPETANVRVLLGTVRVLAVCPYDLSAAEINGALKYLQASLHTKTAFIFASKNKCIKYAVST